MNLRHTTTIEAVLEHLIANGVTDLGRVYGQLFELAMQIEREQHLKAGRYERTPERQGYANGYKPKRVDTPAGTKILQVHAHESALLAVALENRPKRVQRVVSRDGLLFPFHRAQAGNTQCFFPVLRLWSSNASARADPTQLQRDARNTMKPTTLLTLKREFQNLTCNKASR